MKTIKDPPDMESGFAAYSFTTLGNLCNFEGAHWVVRRSFSVQITSQVERTEPDEVAVEESDEAYTKCDSDTIEEAISADYDEGEHTSMEGENTGALGSDMECADDSTDVDTEAVDATTGYNDQEDTSEHMAIPTRSSVETREDELDIQFVKVITI